ncbi:MAG: hypothetical protein ABIR36_16405 [Nitrospiraceae bacterium]
MNRMIFHAAGTTAKESIPQSCTRCNGYLVHEMCADLESDSGVSAFWVHRCIQCGDVTDEVILRNRLSGAETVCAAAA